MKLPDPNAVLPHGFPMLLVDKSLDHTPGREIVTEKRVGPEEPCFDGLEEGCDPLYPSTLVLESLVQSGALLWLDHLERSGKLESATLLLGGVRGCRISGTVRAGDTIVHTVTIDRLFDDNVIFSGRSAVDGIEVMSIESVVAALRAN
ncbi:3-hydroxyacyl-ACP dehydratase FabZ family protein [Nocardia sp. NPDC059177]|uniref:3-hydroxyacyl-ACP dehydratase FabZ family protein n=1 Tax=Nocardia sp. NPDC059177 TaxID=3346759 RepID=UPI003689ED40